jgi:hypothetical protein
VKRRSGISTLKTMSPYWESQMAPLNNGVGNLSAGLARLPMIRAQAAMMGQRAGLYQQEAEKNAADVGLVGAQTDKEKQITSSLANTLALVNKIQTAGPAARTAMLAGKQNDPSIDDLTGAVAALTGANKGDVWKSMASSIGTPRAAAGDVQGAANVENPVSVANNAADNAEKSGRPVIVPSGGTSFTPDGQPIATGGVTLNPGQQRFAPQGNLTVGLQPGQQMTPDQMEDMEDGGQPPAAPAGAAASMLPVIASVAPLPPKVAPVKPTPGLPPGVQEQLFKQALANSDGGTNVTQALGALKAASGAGGGSPQMPTINTQEDYDALPPGSQYMDSNGKVAIKRGK